MEKDEPPKKEFGIHILEGGTVATLNNLKVRIPPGAKDIFVGKNVLIVDGKPFSHGNCIKEDTTPVVKIPAYIPPETIYTARRHHPDDDERYSFPQEKKSCDITHLECEEIPPTPEFSANDRVHDDDIENIFPKTRGEEELMLKIARIESKRLCTEDEHEEKEEEDCVIVESEYIPRKRGREEYGHEKTVFFGYCLICSDKERCMIYKECGHFVSCEECSLRLGDTCAICRKKSRLKKVFS